VVYHGVRQTCAGCMYRLGIALFDLESPDVCLSRGDEWVFGAETEYELIGDVGNVVFPCGHTVEPDGDGLRLYYGAADSCIAVATTKISALLDWLDTHGRPYAVRRAEEQGAYRGQEQRE
jgi:beta-1,2-mannobiose phosphorylase / 1,2-beta-oligomannan phosphorylase